MDFVYFRLDEDLPVPPDLYLRVYGPEGVTWDSVPNSCRRTSSFGYKELHRK